MTCLTDEQLGQLALGPCDDTRLTAHVDGCSQCRAKLEAIRQITERLAAAHAELDRAHVASRTKLLASLMNRDVPTRTVSVWGRVMSKLGGLTARQRIAIGGVSVSTAAALLVILFVFANSAGQLSAMERMLKAVREVNSYSYKLYTQDTFVRKGDSQPSTVIQTGTTYWLKPKSLYYDEKLVRYEGTAPQGEGKLLMHLTGIHPAGKPGMIISHDGVGKASKSMVRTYGWVPEIPSMSAEDVGRESPITRLRMVREGEGEVLRELGTKQIDGKQARGYVMALKDAKPDSGFDALEVWVDPDTDLPLEFGFELKNDELTRIYRTTDCRWNIEVDPKLFDTTPPEGYEDITPPGDENAIAQIVEALRLYAQLSGGHYPRGTPFSADAIRNEMLKLVKYTGQRQEDWLKLQQIEQATVGLNRIAPVLRSTINAGYYGTQVGPQDKDKVLLWWRAVDPQDSPESTHEFSYRVFYGDLRTAILPLTEWSKLVPADTAAAHQP